MKTRNSTTLVEAMVTAVTMEEEEYNGCNGTDPQRCLDDTLLRLTDEILLHSIAATTVGTAAVAAAAGSTAIKTTLMPVINVGALFIGREEQEGNDGSGMATEDDKDAALSQFWEGIFGRRATTAKTIKMSRDNEHKEDVMPRLMFESLCEGVRREMRRGHRRRRPPTPAADHRHRKTRLNPRGLHRLRRCPTALLRGTWQERWQRRNRGYICTDNNIEYIRQRDVHNCITTFYLIKSTSYP